MFGLFGGMGGGSFQGHYRCYPVSFMDKADAESGNKIFLPSSALDRLASLHIEYPMLFKVENRGNSKFTHCGVLEFSADEGMVYMPYWMMQNLLVEEGAVVTISSATLPKGTYVKLQPHTSDFLDISNPKAVLETTLRGFSCLTRGDCICLHYNNKRYYIDIVVTRPQDAISVIETDCEVDFAPPLDYVEPQRPDPAAAAAAAAAAAEQQRTADGAGPSGAAQGGEEEAPQEPKMLAFTGTGRRLDGKPAAGGAPKPVSSDVGIRRPPPPQAPNGAAAGQAGPAGPSANGAAGGAAGQKKGKVVFGTGNRLLDKQLGADGGKGGGGGGGQPKKPEPKPEEKKEPESKFKAFTGKPRSLRD